MDKKQFLLAVLKKLEPERVPAAGLQVLVIQDKLTDQVMHSMIQTIKSSVGTAKTEQTNQKLKKSATLLEQIHAEEEVSLQKDQELLQDLEKQLANL